MRNEVAKIKWMKNENNHNTISPLFKKVTNYALAPRHNLLSETNPVKSFQHHPTIHIQISKSHILSRLAGVILTSSNHSSSIMQDIPYKSHILPHVTLTSSIPPRPAACCGRCRRPTTQWWLTWLPQTHSAPRGRSRCPGRGTWLLLTFKLSFKKL